MPEVNGVDYSENVGKLSCENKRSRQAARVQITVVGTLAPYHRRHRRLHPPNHLPFDRTDV